MGDKRRECERGGRERQRCLRTKSGQNERDSGGEDSSDERRNEAGEEGGKE